MVDLLKPPEMPTPHSQALCPQTHRQALCPPGPNLPPMLEPSPPLQVSSQGPVVSPEETNVHSTTSRGHIAADCRKDVTCLKTHFSADKGCTRKGDCTSRKALCFIFIMHSKKIKIQKIDFRASLSQPSGMLSRYVALTPPFSPLPTPQPINPSPH